MMDLVQRGEGNMSEEIQKKENVYECPNCHSDNIQRYEVAFQNGIADVNTTTVGAGFSGKLGIGAASTQGTQQSALSQSTAPPKKKGYLSKFVLSTILAMVLASPIGGDAATFVFFLIWGGLIYFLVYKKTYLWNKDVYPGLLEQWRHSYVCLRCGNRFIL